jgi:hypothetical protein
MTKIKINDLPEGMTVSKSEMESIKGGLQIQSYPAPYPYKSFWTYGQISPMTTTIPFSSGYFTSTISET